MMQITKSEMNMQRLETMRGKEQQQVAKAAEPGGNKPQAVGVKNTGSSAQDTITIGTAAPESLSDSQFIEVVKKRLLSEVYQEAPEYKINDLRNQVAMGEYDINVSEVVRKMVLESEA